MTYHPPPPPKIFKFFVTDDETTLPAKKQSEEELTASLNNIISENVEWLLNLGSNHVKLANWSKDPKAIIVTMVWNIDKNRTDDLPDGKAAYDVLQEVVLDLFLGATLANRKPQSKLKFMRVLTQHSDGLPMDNGLLYHYIRKHPNFEDIRFSLTPRFEHPRPTKPGQIPRLEYTKTVICEIFDMEMGAVTKKCLGSMVKFDSNPSTCEKFIFKSFEDKKNCMICQRWDHPTKFLTNINVIQGDFNLHHLAWDTSVHSQSDIGTALLHTTFLQDLSLISPPSSPTHVSKNHPNRILDLVFMKDHTCVLTKCEINLKGRGSSDHAIITIEWMAESTPFHPPYIKKDSEAELIFLTNIGEKEWWQTPDMSLDREEILQVTQSNFSILYDTIHDSWRQCAKPGSTGHPTPWWNNKCQKAKDNVGENPTQQNRWEYQKQIHDAQQSYYHAIVQDASTSRKPWKPAKWGNQRPPPTFSTIKLRNDNKQISNLTELWSCLHSQFNSMTLTTPELEEIDTFEPRTPCPFYTISRAEIQEALSKTANSSAPGLDHLTWRHVKYLWNHHNHFHEQLQDSLNWSITNVFWLTQFKESITIVIPKPNKDDYTSPKSY
ncbi:hypothetical protein AMATHDRAFT_8554 [Amanita thiersii Skay4041]|uniref:Endonuclease/exonuclease/phosphatase domain-containing protein n=1 Tax=Amanita thiersii Skay4041 TaxID=703135 RepID=A0A2A9N6S8_9AGAR|nr:hypothetical protein AMATHDRAFT_8554 [Amanita thiersii Skay4041]